MKRFLIAYTFRLDPQAEAAWHRHVSEFIAELRRDVAIDGRVTYTCMKVKDSAAYYHLAEAEDDEAVTLLTSREYFKRYTAETKRVAGGEVEVRPLETLASTSASPHPSGRPASV